MTAPRRSPTLATVAVPLAAFAVILLAWHLAWLILAVAVAIYVAGDRHGRRRQARGLAKWAGRRG